MYRWIGGEINKDLARRFLETAHLYRTGTKIPKKVKEETISVKVTKKINKLVSEKSLQANEIVEETKKNNMEIIIDNFDKLFNKFEKQENELNELKKCNVVIIKILEQLLNDVIINNENHKISNAVRLDNYKFICKEIATMKTFLVSNNEIVANSEVLLSKIFKGKKTELLQEVFNDFLKQKA